MAATHILLPQQPYLNVIERKYNRQILEPDPIILAPTPTQNSAHGVEFKCCPAQPFTAVFPNATIERAEKLMPHNERYLSAN